MNRFSSRWALDYLEQLGAGSRGPRPDSTGKRPAPAGDAPIAGNRFARIDPRIWGPEPSEAKPRRSKGER